LLIGPADEVTTEGRFKGWRAVKMPWSRGDGVAGELIVTGTRLDATAPMAIDIARDNQYGTTGFTPVSLAFPSAGCWEITGIAGTHSVTFTLLVTFTDVDPWATPAR
ncbi:unnamed protein product, partial [Phaeothamnion confervicola]